MKLRFEGRAWKLRDDVDTDIIIPTQYLVIPDMQEMKRHVFEPLRPELASLIEPGNIIVAGKNFGCGSSREQAPELLTLLGVSCVIAKSFARIFFRNSINNGLLLLENGELFDFCEEGDTVAVEINRRILCRGREFSVPQLPKDLFEILSDGGLVKSMQKRNGILGRKG